MFLSENELSGTIPNEIGNLAYLSSFYVNENQITGELPSELGLCLGLEYLQLQNNQLEGIIPEAICGLGLDWGSVYNFNISENFILCIF